MWLRKDGSVTIIDWETVETRSQFYDYAALYLGLRSTPIKQKLYDRLRHDNTLQNVFNVPPIVIARVVMAEDLAYQTEELVSLPGIVGVEEYNSIIEQYKKLQYD